MNYAAQSLLLALGLTLSVGCCGPMWNPGCCGTGCATTCDSGCGSCGGCGELYIDPWINDPADCCDPCDSCGNYNGQSCGKCRPVFAGIKSLWGYRCDDGCGVGACDGGCDGGCDSGCCDGGAYGSGIGHPGVISGYVDGGGQSYELGEGETIVESSISNGSSASSASNPRITSQPRITHRSGNARQIFQPRRVDEPRSALAY
ncbi:hypothetical protein [Aporhodopirellula aestuarii]|uniref:Uncharacterized protein n=1 Tax=Aporhodopirellula aestuarii TaxID=2950107 RepID=A0ABT0U6M8_9BACT|nr:hypothetical protein [Aporhodopirellula aestuarii]MCM2372571.1 hypothetical protein [Aporhodopirellula aestuarii]